MQTPRLIAVDMDGTLLNENGAVSPRTLAAMRNAADAGIEVVIATGRRHAYAMRVLRALDLDPHNAVISSNGAVIRTIGSRLLDRSHMDLDTARWFVSHVGDYRSCLMLTFDRVNEHGHDTRGALVCQHREELNVAITGWMQANEPYILEVERIEDSLLGDDAPIQMMLCGSIDRMTAAEQHLLTDPRVTAVGQPHAEDSAITLHRTLYPGKDLSIVDILPSFCSKATGLDHLARLRGIAREDIMAIGDNFNDLPMLEWAGHPVLMTNAPAGLRAIGTERGWHTAPSNDQDGVAHILEQVVAYTLVTR